MLWDQLVIGSNVFVSTNGAILEDGEAVVHLERAGTGDQALLTVEVYEEVDGEVKRVARLKRNAWVFNDGTRYAINSNPSNLVLSDTSDDRVVVEVNAVNAGSGVVEITRGSFLTPAGKRIEVEPDRLVIGGAVLTGNTIVAPKGIVLTDSGMGIGAA